MPYRIYIHFAGIQGSTSRNLNPGIGPSSASSGYPRQTGLSYSHRTCSGNGAKIPPSAYNTIASKGTATRPRGSLLPSTGAPWANDRIRWPINLALISHKKQLDDFLNPQKNNEDQNVGSHLFCWESDQTDIRTTVEWMCRAKWNMTVP
jgi:hypothetical protein